MDIENMQAFVSVAELRSLTEAAQKLNHLQSNMTAKIKKLEAHYGTALFYRKPRGMELTPAGETLYAQFKQMLLLWQDTEMKMRPQEEKLRIGTMQSIVAGETTRALTKVYELYPQASVTLKTGTTTEMERLILDGELDIALLQGIPPTRIFIIKKYAVKNWCWWGKAYMKARISNRYSKEHLLSYCRMAACTSRI